MEPDFADPFAFMNYWYDSKNFGLAGNRAFYKNPKVDSLLRQAATTNNQSQRLKLYNDAQKKSDSGCPVYSALPKRFCTANEQGGQGLYF
ncbi:hypothetical protein QS257_20695 [Terrilactibacillus sp. S3-3]|nr:hypothetical protein QS257_20695 [Terrilactibacillus sp. S3-3]